MPAPRMEPVDLITIAREGLSLQQIAFADVAFTLDCADEQLEIVADAGQIGRVLTNLLQNAAEAIERRVEQEGADAEPG